MSVSVTLWHSRDNHELVLHCVHIVNLEEFALPRICDTFNFSSSNLPGISRAVNQGCNRSGSWSQSTVGKLLDQWINCKKHVESKTCEASITSVAEQSFVRSLKPTMSPKKMVTQSKFSAETWRISVVLLDFNFEEPFSTWCPWRWWEGGSRGKLSPSSSSPGRAPAPSQSPPWQKPEDE